MIRKTQVSTARPDFTSDELKILIESIEEYAFFKIDTNGKILSWNEGVKRVLGYSKKDFLNKNFTIIFTKDDLRNSVHKRELNRVKRLGKADDERWHKRKDGTIFRSSGITTKLYDTDRKVKGYVKIIRDISNVLEYSRKIKESEEKYKSFINNTAEGIWRFDLEIPIQTSWSISKQVSHIYKYAYLAECNDATAKMYGYKKAEDIVGANLGEFLVRDNPDNVKYLQNFILSGYKLINAESVEIDKNGNSKHFTNNLIGIIDNSKVIAAWGSQRDITMQYEIIRQKDEFVGVVSHELKTPLTSIKAYVQMLQKKLINHDEATTLYLNKVNSQLNKLSTLINELLDVTRMESGRFHLDIQKFKLIDLVNEVVDDMQNISDRHKIFIKGTYTSNIESDRERVAQILINLISNAVKYSPNANKIIVKIEQLRRLVKISVQDFGIGISRRDQKRIFERFYRVGGDKANTFPGLGLGLYISYELADRLGGKITVKSIKGKGSTFTLVLPK